MEIHYLFYGINTFIWGVLGDWILFVGLFMTLAIDFQTIWKLPKILHFFERSLRTPSSRRLDVLPAWQSVILNSSAIIGVGNFVGTALAIYIGGPGVVFWACVSIMLGFAPRFAEAYLSFAYRLKNDCGEWVGGPMYYLQAKMPKRLKWFAIIFAFFTLLSTLYSGNFFQAKVIGVAFQHWVGIPELWTCVLMSVLSALIISGGLRRIVKACIFLSPLALGLSVVMCASTLLMHASEIPTAATLILRDALSLKAIMAGSLAAVIGHGVRLGVLTNGAGLGREVMLQTASEPADPLSQAFTAVAISFFELIFVIMIALLIVMSGSYLDVNSPVQLIWAALDWGWEGSGLLFLLVGFSMGFTTIIAYYVIGERCFDFLFGTAHRWLFRLFWVLMIVVFYFLPTQISMQTNTIIVSLACMPNLLGLLILSSTIFRFMRSGFQRIDHDSLIKGASSG